MSFAREIIENIYKGSRGYLKAAFGGEMAGIMANIFMPLVAAFAGICGLIFLSLAALTAPFVLLTLGIIPPVRNFFIGNVVSGLGLLLAGIGGILITPFAWISLPYLAITESGQYRSANYPEMSESKVTPSQVDIVKGLNNHRVGKTAEKDVANNRVASDIPDRNLLNSEASLFTRPIKDIGSATKRHLPTAIMRH